MPLTFEGVNPEEVFRRLLSEAKTEDSLVQVITSHDPESAAVAGLIARILKSSDIDFEILSDAYEHQISDAKVIGVNVSPSSCEGCVILQSASSNSAVRMRFNYLLRYSPLVAGVLELASEFDIVPKDVKILLAVASLWGHTPRIIRGKLNSREESFMKSLMEDGIIEFVEGPPIIGWAYLPKEKAVKYSIDALIPSRFMNDELKQVAADDVIRELGLGEEDAKTRSFIVKTEWVTKDLFLANYVLQWLMDTAGFGSVCASVINKRYMMWGLYGLIHSYEKIKDIVNDVLQFKDQGKEPIKQVVARADPTKVSATVLTKIFEGLRVLDLGGRVVIEWGGKYFVPLSILSSDERKDLVSRGKLIGGYAALAELPER